MTGFGISARDSSPLLEEPASQYVNTLRNPSRCPVVVERWLPEWIRRGEEAAKVVRLAPQRTLTGAGRRGIRPDGARFETAANAHAVRSKAGSTAVVLVSRWKPSPADWKPRLRGRAPTICGIGPGKRQTGPHGPTTPQLLAKAAGTEAVQDVGHPRTPPALPAPIRGWNPWWDDLHLSDRPSARSVRCPGRGPWPSCSDLGRNQGAAAGW